MSCTVRGGLKSRDRLGVCKKRVHFIDEAKVSVDVVAEDDLQAGDHRAQTQAKECSFTSETPRLDEVFSKVAISCDADAKLMQKGGHLQEDSCHIAEEKLNTVKEVKKAAFSCGVDGINCLVENESPSTPPACGSYGLASPKAEPQSQIPVMGHVQRKLTFRVDSREQCHTKFGLTSRNYSLSKSHNYYKVVPEEAEEGGLPMKYLMPQHDPSGLSQDASKKRCAWITPQSDPVYVAYHDEEWGVAVHEDRRLFELLVFAGAQAEMAWSTLVAKREAYRNLFAQFDPTILASYDATTTASLRSNNDLMRSEARVQSIVNNAKLVMKIVEEYGSFDAYLWGFVSNRPIVNRYRQPKLVPVRSGKSEAISKDLQRRGFRHAGPIVVYSLMQAAGLANDHLLSCFRHHALLLPPQLSSSSSSPSPEALRRKPAAARKPLASPLCC